MTIDPNATINAFRQDVVAEQSNYIIEGGAVTQASSSSINIAPFIVHFQNTHDSPGIPKSGRYHHPGETNLTLTYLATAPGTFLYYYIPTRTIVQTPLAFFAEDLRDYISIDSIPHPFGVYIGGTEAKLGNAINSCFHQDVRLLLGLKIITGGKLKPVGTSDQLQLEAGTFALLAAMRDTPKNPSFRDFIAQNPINILYVWRDGVGGHVFRQTTSVQPGYWDNNSGTGGTGWPADTVLTNQVTNQNFLFQPGSTITGAHFSQTAPYGTLDTALARGQIEKLLVNPVVGVTIPRTRISMVNPAATIDLSNASQALFKQYTQWESFDYDIDV